MDLTEIKSNSQSLLLQVQLDTHKLGLDLQKSQTLSLLPTSPDYVLSTSLLNKIAESRWLTSDIIQNYQDRVKEAVGEDEAQVQDPGSIDVLI